MTEPMRFEIDAVKRFMRNLATHEDADYMVKSVLENSSVKDSHRKGMSFETWVGEHARGLGFRVEEGQGRTDLIINGWRVQCKHVDEQRNGSVCISNMRPVKANAGLRGYLVSDVDFFFVKTQGIVYVLPVADITADGIVVNQMVEISKINHRIDDWLQLRDNVGPHGVGYQDLF